MFTIRLNKLKIFAFHGVHSEESIAGNEFEVSVLISFLSNKKIDSLDDSINYVEVYNIIKKHFAIPVQLLETLAQTITEDIHKIDNRISSINITIDKLNAPICSFTGTVGVNYSKSYP